MAENQAQASRIRFLWTIEKFPFQISKSLHNVFEVAGHKWRLWVFPKGNNVDHLSVYLQMADFAPSPHDRIYTYFSLGVVDQMHQKFMIRRNTHHVFSGDEDNWGFTSFMPLSDLYDPSKGYLVNGECIIEAEVAVLKATDYWSSESKKETGYVGLKNQGATCYMNSLLQTLYLIPYFRKAVYQMATTNDMPFDSIPLSLQSIFYKLQYNGTSVATKELTKSFGWDKYDSFTQHDVQELNRVLCEKLEDNMKGRVVEGTIQKLFEGHHMNYIECINMDFKSTTKEAFYDLQLDVKGCQDVYASFDKYVEVERLEGDNKYHVVGHDFQDARKGVLFTDFPPVLKLQLMRFEYDFTRKTMVKINDQYEFPLELDLDTEGGKYLSPDADKSVGNLYTLHSVLVHGGVTSGGHYYALIRPTLSDQWFMFDDENVTKEDSKRALDEQYGGEEEHSNAYMLVYIRESDKEKIICDMDEKDISEDLRIRLRTEQKEKEDKRIDKAEDHLYTIIKVACEEDISAQIGKSIYFDLIDREKVCSFHIQKETPFTRFKEEVVKEYGIPVQFLRFWICAKRENQTYRPKRPLNPQEEAQSVGQLRDAYNEVHNAELEFFLEIAIGTDNKPLPPKAEDDLLVFFKLYDPEKLELRFVGRLFVKSDDKLVEIIPKLNEMAGFSPDEEIELYEEITSEPNVICDRLEKGDSFRSCKIENGDIICFQKLHQTPDVQKYQYPDVPSFLEYVKNCQIVHFRSLDRPKEGDFYLEMSKLHTYDDVVERVAHKLDLDDPSKIRLTTHNCNSHQPESHHIKYRVADHLLDMLVHDNQMSDILYYEVLDIPLTELECLKTLKIVFLHATKKESVIHTIRLPKPSTVKDFLIELKKRVELSHPDAVLRLIEVFEYKIHSISSLTDIIDNRNDEYWTLLAEEIPEEEKNHGPKDMLIPVCHFCTDVSRMQVKNFGHPFLLLLHENETLGHVRIRIQKKLQVSNDEFSRWKFALRSLEGTKYLGYTDIVYNCFKGSDVFGLSEHHLGLEHPDTTPRSSRYTSIK